MKFVADQGGKVFGETYAADNPAAAQAGPLFKGIALQTGLGFSAAIGTTNTQPDYTAACETFKQSNTTDVGVEGAPLISSIARDCARQGYFPRWTGGDGQVATNAWLNDPNVKVALANAYSFPYILTKGNDATQTASLQRFHAAMNKYAPQILKGDGKQSATTFWTGAIAFETALKKIPKGTQVTPAAIKEALYTFNEPPREGCRLRSLRGWSHGTFNEVSGRAA